MTENFAHQPAPAGATVADVMRPALTTGGTVDHAAAAAYLMKRAGATALMVLDSNGQPIGIITEADIAHAVADGTDLNHARIHEVMTSRPTVIEPTTAIVEAATIMTRGHFRHLPVMAGAGLVGIVDITDICRALIGPGIAN